MKKFLVICCMLATICMIAFASGQKTESVTLTTSAPTVTAKAEIANLLNMISQAKERGETPEAAWYARLEALTVPVRVGESGSLDNGGPDCSGAFVITGPYPWTDTGNFDGNDGCTGRPYNDRFYRIDNAAVGTWTFNMCGTTGTADSYLRVWKGGVCCSGINYTNGDMGCPDGDHPTTSVALTTVQTIYIEVGTYSTTANTGAYNFGVTSPAPPAPGESCSNFLTISGPLPVTVTGTTTGKADDHNPMCENGGSTAPDMAYHYTPATDQQVDIDLCLSGYDTKVGVYLASNVAPGAEVYCNDDYCPGYRSFIGCAQLNAGVEYCIVVDGYSSADFGAFTMTLTECAPCDPPVNNDCANAIPLVVNDPVATCGTTACATVDCPQFNIPEVWYTFTTTECMDLAVSYCGTTTSGSLLAVLMSGSCCGTPTYFSSYEYTTCPDGLITLHFDNVPAGQYWLPVGFSPAGPFCVQVNGTPCPLPFECHCLDQLDGRWCNTVGGPILDVSPNSFPIVVPIEYHITDVDVCLDLVHTFDGDLHIYLESPLGTLVDLSINRGGGGDNFTCTTFDDEATTPIASGVPPFTGSFIPDAALTGFDGQNAIGTWILHIDDVAGGDVGNLNWACLTFTWDYILAVELASFSAIAGDNSVTLNWSTATETNNDHFIVMRDGSPVAVVRGAGTSSTTINYSWVDSRVNNGTTYNYALVAVDMNGGRSELSTASATPSINAVTVTEYALHTNYPNPFNPTTEIVYDMKDAGVVSLKVYNLLGQAVASLVNGNVNAGRHTVRFDAAGLTSGLYIYKMETNGFSAQGKMMLMK